MWETSFMEYRAVVERYYKTHMCIQFQIYSIIESWGFCASPSPPRTTSRAAHLPHVARRSREAPFFQRAVFLLSKKRRVSLRYKKAREKEEGIKCAHASQADRATERHERDSRPRVQAHSSFPPASTAPTLPPERHICVSDQQAPPLRNDTKAHARTHRRPFLCAFLNFASRLTHALCFHIHTPQAEEDQHRYDKRSAPAERRLSID